MVVFKGIIRGGQVLLPQPASLPDGTEVTVVANGQIELGGIPDDVWPTRQEAITALLERIDQLEPFDMSAAEEAEIDAWRKHVKQHMLAKQNAATTGPFE